MDNKNPECTDLEELQKNLEKTIKKVPNSEVHCKSNSNCTGNIKSNIKYTLILGLKEGNYFLIMSSQARLHYDAMASSPSKNK